MPSLIDRFHSWLRGLLGYPAITADQAASTAAGVQIVHEPRERFVPYDENLLEQSRAQWQLGDWGGLTQLTREALQHHPDRAKLALLAAAGQLQNNNISAAQQFIRAALDWGCSKKMVSQVLVSGVYSTLGNAAIATGDKQRALSHFKTAASVGNQKANSILLAETQVMRETSRLAQELQSAAFLVATTSPAIPTPVKPDTGIVSYAQNFEDVMLWRALGRIENGFYIDVGAQDPDFDSVSKAFYEHGWRGVHVEPLPEYVQALRKERSDEEVIDTILADEIGYRTYFQVPKTGMSTGIREFAEKNKQSGWEFQEVTVLTSTLANVFDRAGGRDIHWLKVDVEGMEEEVLKGWHDHPARPWIVVVEATAPNTQTSTWERWQHYLTDRNYEFVYFDGLNRFYVHIKHKELSYFFDSPPNVFDGFLLAKHSDRSKPLIPPSLSWRVEHE